MNWVLFTGTWRLTNKEVEADVRQAVSQVISRGDGVLTGGATGVDFFAMDEALKTNPTCSHLKIIIPSEIENYINDVYTNWCHHPIKKEDIDLLAKILRQIKNINPDNFIEMPQENITQEEYDLRNIEEVKIAQEVFAFQVNNSSGTQHTIDQAKLLDVPISVNKKYEIAE